LTLIIVLIVYSTSGHSQHPSDSRNLIPAHWEFFALCIATPASSPPLETKVGGQTDRGAVRIQYIVRPCRKWISLVRAHASPAIDWFRSVLKKQEQEMWENILIDFDLPEIHSKMYSESVFQSV